MHCSPGQCAPGLFCCPSLNMCMDESTGSTRGPACEACEYEAPETGMVKLRQDSSKHNCAGSKQKHYHDVTTPEECSQKCSEDWECKYVSFGIFTHPSVTYKRCIAYASCETMQTPATNAEFWNWLGSWKKAGADLGGDSCFEKDTNYALHDLTDAQKDPEIMAEVHANPGLLSCQRACARLPDCTHFTFRPAESCKFLDNDGCHGCCYGCDGGCYVKGFPRGAEPERKAVRGQVSGPKRCPVQVS